MEFAYHIDGGTAPYIKKYQIAQSLTVPGIPLCAETLSDVAGLIVGTTTAAAEMVGVSLDVPAARVTAQQPDNSDPERLVSLVINPNAVFKGHLIGGAAAGTLLALFANTVVSTNGLLITATIAAAPYDDGYAFGYDGANVGGLRKMVAVGGTSATLVVAFQWDIAVGDNFLLVTFGPGELSGVQLSTNLDEIDATGDNQAGTNFRCVELLMRDRADEGRGNSFAYITPIDHAFASS